MAHTDYELARNFADGDCQSDSVAAADHHQEQEAGNTEADIAVSGIVLSIADAPIQARQPQETQTALESTDSRVVAEDDADAGEGEDRSQNRKPHNAAH